MAWARARLADGRVAYGVIEAETFQPRAGLGEREPAGEAQPLDTLRLLPPCKPRKFVGLWNNFHAAAARNKQTIPEHPLFFLKPQSSLSGPGATVTIPPSAGRVVFEGELGVVIGRTVGNVTAAEAEGAILGYTCVNDFTSLDVLNADPAFPQWTRAKGFDGFGAVGPVIATGLDWRSLEVRVTVNGRERQAYPASDMILSPPEIVAALSQDMTLHPGDLIACGTSLGARPVRPGDAVTVAIEGIGALPTTMA